MANSKGSGTSRAKTNAETEGKQVPTEAPQAELTPAQERADTERRDWEQRMQDEAQEAEAQRDDAPRA